MDWVPLDMDEIVYPLGMVWCRSVVEMDKINSQIAAHPAVAEFNSSVGSMRRVVNTTQVQTLKSYPRNN